MTPYEEQQETGSSYAANYITIITTVIITTIKTRRHSHFNSDCYLNKLYYFVLCLVSVTWMLHLFFSAGFEIRHPAVRSARN